MERAGAFADKTDMKTTSTIHILLVISGLALATAPGHAQADGPLPIVWQATYGPGMIDGVGYAIPYDFVQTADGGFLIAGFAYGSTNDIRTVPICPNIYNFWVIKIDAQGHRQWDKSCGGEPAWGPGSSASRVFLAPDGGFMLAGYVTSAAGCCQTAPLHGLVDAWAVRYDPNANKLWDQTCLPDGLTALWGWDFEQTADAGYLGCGLGAVSGVAGWYGIVKFDAQGQQMWTKTIGCLTSGLAGGLRILETADGGFIVAGSSGAEPCGDKTSPYFGGYDPGNGFLGSDFWVVQCDAQQNKVWDKSYGGADADLALDMHPLADGGFMVFGTSESPPETDPTKGTKTSPSYGDCDYWMIRIDAQGNQLWDRSYGGAGDDVCTCAEPMPDGGWLLSGNSTSVPSGNKTSPSFGSSDIWIVRIDDQGNKLWEQSFGGSGIEGKQWRPFAAPQFARERIKHTADGGFLLTGWSQSPVSGLKTAPLISQGDYWVLKLGPEPPSLRAEVTPEGKFQLCLIAPPELSHTIQGSADLATWTDLDTRPPNAAGKEYWTDPDKLAHRFYRAVRK